MFNFTFTVIAATSWNMSAFHGLSAASSYEVAASVESCAFTSGPDFWSDGSSGSDKSALNPRPVSEVEICKLSTRISSNAALPIAGPSSDSGAFAISEAGTSSRRHLPSLPSSCSIFLWYLRSVGR
jgi:hypothetical protein